MNNSTISFICSDESRINCFLNSYKNDIKYNKNNILRVIINNKVTSFTLVNKEIKNIKNNSNINKKYIFYIFSYNDKIKIDNIDNINYFFSSDNISSITKIKEISQNKEIIILPCSHPTRSTKSPCNGSMLYTVYYTKANKKNNDNIQWKYYLGFYKIKQQCRNTNFLLEAMKIILSLDSNNSKLVNSKNNQSITSKLPNNQSIASKLISSPSITSKLTNNDSGYEANNQSITSNSYKSNIYINNSLNYKKKIKYYYILGLGCSKKNNKNKIHKSFFNKSFNNTNNKRDVTIICKSYHKAVFTIAKRLVGLPPSNSEYLLNIQNDILEDLKKYKEVIICGHSYGGSLISRIAKNLNNNNIKYNNLKMYTFGSIYIPREELDNINIIHFMNFSDISLRLSKTNYNNLIKNKNISTKNITLPFKWVKKNNIIKYFISNNKQIFYISLDFNKINNKISNRSILSISSEWEKHNDYYYIQFSILNSEKFRQQLANIIINME